MGLENFSWNRPIWSYTAFHVLVNSTITPHIRNKPWLVSKKAVKKSKYMQVGCGYNIYEDMVNVDIEWKPGVIPWDISVIKKDNYPVPDNYLKGIYTEHCLEHIPFQSAWDNMYDFFRVLEPGGTVRIAVPDGEFFVDAYVTIKNGGEAYIPDRGKYGEEPTPMMSVNRIARGFGHLYFYDFQTMEHMLKRVGFVDIKKETFRSSRDERLRIIDSELRKDGTLYVEATKPK